MALAEERPAPDEAEVNARFVAFLKAATLRRDPSGPRRRFNQGRATAYVEAEFRVLSDLSPHLRVGLFAAPRTYRASIRFANAASATDRERDIRGMSMRVHDVEGRHLTPGRSVQDFVLNSHPVMLAANTRGFMELLEANEAGGFQRALYFLRNPNAIRVGLAARTNPTCHLDLSYWSTTPYLFGPGRAVKYIVRPVSTRRSPKPLALTDSYLQDAMRVRLAEAEVEFEFLVQFQVDNGRMPIEDASVEWRTEDSPYIPIARLRIPSQSFEDPVRVAEGERLAFNPWHCLEEHRPLGGMNRSRRAIYDALAAFRAEAATT